MGTTLKLLRHFRDDLRGHVAVVFGMVFAPAIMLVGGAIDFGNAYKAQQRLQAAADAAVLAAVGMPSGTQAAARQAMAINVFNANTQGFTAAPPSPVVSGDTVSLSVSANVPTAFLAIANLPTLTVRGSSSSAVTYATTTNTTTNTTTSAGGKACLLALDASATNGFISQGTPNVQLGNCWGHTNATSATAIAGGGNAQASAAGWSAVGGVTSSANSVYTATPVGGRNVVADPFATVSAYQIPYSSYQSTFTAPPIPTTCTASNLNLKKNSFTLSPGRYCGGINMQAQATVTLQPGIYIIDNGEFNVQAGASISGSNVLLYFSGANARFTVIGGGTVNLKGRSNGNSYAGFVFIAHPNAWRGLTSNIQGGGNFTIEGMIYAPTQNVLITGNGDANQNSNFMAIVAKSFEFRGNGIYRFKTWNSASNMPDIMPVTSVTTTTTTISTTTAVERVRLQ